MTFAEWKAKLNEYNISVEVAQGNLDHAEQARNAFLLETVGFERQSLATLAGTVEMIAKVIDMKKGEK